MISVTLMEERDFNYYVTTFISKIKHYLITMMGIVVNEANDEQLYHALSMILREEIMINWTATLRSIKKNKPRILYYLCMEYMPGKFLGSNITNLRFLDFVKEALKRLNRDFGHLCHQERDPGLGNGGLGRLACCILDSLATHSYPCIAYGLRYQYGIFDQEIYGGIQVEKPELWLFHKNPWEFRKDDLTKSVKFEGEPVPTINAKGIEIFDTVNHEEVRAIPYDIPIIGYREKDDFSVATLRLWTTKESPRNFELQRFNAGFLDQAVENTSLTDVLYPNDNNKVGKRFRLKQEFLLSSASVQDIIENHLSIFPDMSSFADKARIQINDTHPSLVIAELMRLLLQDHNFGWEEAWEVVKKSCNFTNHTILRESLEEWNENRFQTLLPKQYQIIQKLNLIFCNTVREQFPGDDERVQRMSIIERGEIRMAHLAVYGSHRVNGVSAFHTEILKRSLFKDFHEMDNKKILNITNGVTQRRFLFHANPLLSAFISARIGSKWLLDFKEIRKLENFASDLESQKQFLAIKNENKKALIAYVKAQNPILNANKKMVGHFLPLDEGALFDVHIKRIHEYKRQLMNALHLIMVYFELKADPHCRQVKRLSFFAGKAAPGYDIAKKIIQLIYCIANKINNDPDVNQKLRVIFIQKYNVSLAELMIPAADLSEQISTAGTEASGTGNMKLAMNGALTIATEDGANIEIREAIGNSWWPFSFGQSAKENEALASHYDPWDICTQRPAIRQALEALRDRSFATTDEEHEALSLIYSILIEKNNLDPNDKYFSINDLQPYYETQKKVEELYLHPLKWAEYALHNIAGMGSFSSDETVHNYAHLIWGLERCSIDPQELAFIRAEYSEHDKCRIL